MDQTLGTLVKKNSIPLAVNKLFSYLAAGRAVLTGLFGINDGMMGRGRSDCKCTECELCNELSGYCGSSAGRLHKRGIDPTTGKPIKHLTRIFGHTRC